MVGMNHYIGLISVICFNFLLMGCSGMRTLGSGSSVSRKLVYIDDAKNGFILEANRSLVKLNANGDEMFRYDFEIPVFKTGMYNDLQFYAFNESFQRFFILDKYLNQITSIDFSMHFPNIVEHPVLDGNQSIWLFNRNENKVQRWTTQFSILTETQNLDLIIPGVSIDQIFIRKNIVYLVDFDKGLYEFDFTGQLVAQHLLPGIAEEVQIDGDRLYFYQTGKWYFINLSDSLMSPKVVLSFEDQSNKDIVNGIFFNNSFYYWNENTSEVKMIDFAVGK